MDEEGTYKERVSVRSDREAKLGTDSQSWVTSYVVQSSLDLRIRGEMDGSIAAGAMIIRNKQAR